MSPVPSTNYLCISCKISFPNGQEQRIHMKEPWHVNNVKRRMASLEPVPLEEFKPSERNTDTKIGKDVHISEAVARRRSSNNDGSDEEASDNGSEQSASPFQCLFCNQDFASDEDGLAANLEHMRITHGMFIPDPDMVIDMQSFVGYLATEIRTWHECIYCGAAKPSTPGIQSHMRDKGHCLLNLEREPELLEFWEPRREVDGDEDAACVEPSPPINLSATEMRFASGKVIASRNAAPTTKIKPSARRELAVVALATGPEDAESPNPGLESQLEQLELGRRSTPGRQLARRDEMGILGVSVQQRQALALAEKKAQRSEDMARRAREWVYAKGANLQKYDQVDGKMKAGKQNHKLQPR